MLANYTDGYSGGVILGFFVGFLVCIVAIIIFFHFRAAHAAIAVFGREKKFAVTKVAVFIITIFAIVFMVLSLFDSPKVATIEEHYKGNVVAAAICDYIEHPYMFVGSENGWFSNDWVEVPARYGDGTSLVIQNEVAVGFGVGFLEEVILIFQTLALCLLVGFVYNYKLFIITIIVDLVIYFVVHGPAKKESLEDAAVLNAAQKEWEKNNSRVGFFEKHEAFKNEEKYNRDKYGVRENGMFERERAIDRDEIRKENDHYTGREASNENRTYNMKTAASFNDEKNASKKVAVSFMPGVKKEIPKDPAEESVNSELDNMSREELLEYIKKNSNK